jgi:hypothetical protein
MKQNNKILHAGRFGDSFKQKMNIGYPWIIEYANSLNPSLVIDAGCGRNMYKGQIQNLIGFDSGDYDNVDFKSTILDANFDDNSADIVMALGSIQFVSLKYIRKNLEKIVGWTKPGGHMIMRATIRDQDHLDKIRGNNKVKLVLWPLGFLEEMTVKLDLEIVRDPHVYEVHYPNDNIYAKKMEWVWRKNV